jgi:lysophospholipase L1-like esterase
VKARLLLLLVSILVSLATAEIVLRRWAPISDPWEDAKRPPAHRYIPSQFPPHYRVVTEAETGLSGISGRNVFSTNNEGFRGAELVAPKPAGELRVFLVGGSTTEGFYLDDDKALHATAQRRLQALVGPGRSVRVYNAGKSGDRSYDHVAMIVHRILHLEPDVIVVFAGINDLSASVNDIDYAHLDQPVVMSLSIGDMVGMMATELQVSRRIYHAARRIAVSSRLADSGNRAFFEEIPLVTNYRQRAELSRTLPVKTAPPRVDPRGYRGNLLTIAGALKSHGVTLVLMTQATTWNSTIDREIGSWHWMLQQYPEEAMDRAMEVFNDTMRAVAVEQHVMLVDLARMLPKSRDYFYDDVHFNEAGSDAAGQALAQVIDATVTPNLGEPVLETGAHSVSR